MKNHTPLEIDSFNGLYARGKADRVPPDHFIDSLNVKLRNGQVESRDGIVYDLGANTVQRVYLYRRAGEVSRYLILNNSGQLFDSTNMLLPINTISSMTDFSAVTLYNRVYWTPHDGNRGLAGHFVHVYDGTTDRVAGGAPPTETSPMVATNSASGGKVEFGTHVLSVAFETSTGFVTRPGGYVTFHADGAKKIDVSSIPVGPSGTIARHLLATRVIDSYVGDYLNQEYFFVPDGTISDNTSTTKTIDFFDGDLFESGDYLIDQLAQIPAGVGIGLYAERVITWGENAEPNIVRVSFPNEPEGFDEIEGFITIDPNDGGGTIKKCWAVRDVLYIGKEFRHRYTSDNGDNAIYWNINTIDGFIGAYPHSVAALYEAQESVLNDKTYIANPSGLWAFDGKFLEVPLSWKIADLWDSINKAYFHKVQVFIDPLKDEIYVNVPLDTATEPSHLLVANLENGFNPEHVKWSIWHFPYKPTSILTDIDFATKESVFKFGSSDNNIYKIEENRRNDNDFAPVTSYIRFAYAQERDGENHFGGIRVRAVGAGNLGITVYSLDDVESIAPPSLTLSLTNKAPLQRSFNFVSWRASVKLSMSLSGEWFRMLAGTIYARLLYEERPEL